MYGYRSNTTYDKEAPIWEAESQQPIQAYSAQDYPSQSYPSQAMALRQNDIFSQASLEVFRNECRAGLASRILNNAAALAALEAQCLMQAPNGANEYRLIMEAYAYRSAMTILESDW